LAGWLLNGGGSPRHSTSSEPSHYLRRSTPFSVSQKRVDRRLTNLKVNVQLAKLRELREVGLSWQLPS
jgi:hypothetical protein